MVTRRTSVLYPLYFAQCEFGMGSSVFSERAYAEYMFLEKGKPPIEEHKALRWGASLRMPSFMPGASWETSA